MMNPQNSSRELAERPRDYLGPNLNPHGLVLTPHRLGEGVYALMANIPPKDNNGVIIGEKCALVIDAGINGAISRQIQELVRRLTDKRASPTEWTIASTCSAFAASAWIASALPPAFSMVEITVCAAASF